MPQAEKYEGANVQRRKLMAYGLASIGLAGSAAHAQNAGIAKLEDVAGTWTGRVEPAGMKLKLSLQPDGKFDLQQSLLTDYTSSGKASIKNGVLMLPLPGGGCDLKLLPDGKLSGPYAGERIKGTASLTKS